MADENRAKIMEQIKQQGDVVRKLKAEKAEKSQVCISIFILCDVSWMFYWIGFWNIIEDFAVKARTRST